jgi:hypothetical protein
MDPNELMAKRNQVQNWCSYRSSAGVHVASLHDQHPVTLFVHLFSRHTCTTLYVHHQHRRSGQMQFLRTHLGGPSLPCTCTQPT